MTSRACISGCSPTTMNSRPPSASQCWKRSSGCGTDPVTAITSQGSAGRYWKTSSVRTSAFHVATPRRLRRAVSARSGQDLEAGHLAAQACQAGGEEPAARADLQHPVRAPMAQGLQQAPLDLGGHHRLAAAERDLGVGEGEVAEAGRNELLPGDLGQDRQHGRVQHVPGPHLLVHHLGAGGFDVHAHWGPLRVSRLPGSDKIMAQSSASGDYGELPPPPEWPSAMLQVVREAGPRQFFSAEIREEQCPADSSIATTE